MTTIAALSSEQREKVQQWLRETGELCVDVYIPKSGRSGTGYFLRSIAELEDLISKQTAPCIVVTIFRQLQYPIRGIADDTMLSEALKTFPDGKWYTIISLDYYYPSEHVLRGCGDNQAELCKDFAKVLGRRVAIGENPFDGNDELIYHSPDKAMVLYFNRRADRYEIEAPNPNA